jgi:putative endonuclease
MVKFYNYRQTNKYDNKKTGDDGEDLAVSFLESRGYKILSRNFRFSHLEIDIIAECEIISGVKVRPCVCFVEVKTRTNTKCGSGRFAVNAKKQKLIKTVGQHFLMTKIGKHYKSQDALFRFDVVEITNKKGKSVLEHIRNAFDCNTGMN